MREYECMLILPAEADEALVSTAVDRIAKTIGPAGGAIGNLDRWGRRRFAFEIDREHEGYYVVLRFTADPSVQPELDRVLNIADEVIRHKILQAPPPSTARPRRTTSREARPSRREPVADEASGPAAEPVAEPAAEPGTNEDTTTASPAPARGA